MTAPAVSEKGVGLAQILVSSKCPMPLTPKAFPKTPTQAAKLRALGALCGSEK